MASEILPRWRELSLLAASVLVVGLGGPAGERARELVDPRRTVLIYAANETRPGPRATRNLEVILGWLRSTDSERAREVADRLEVDRERYPSIVDEEVAGILEGAMADVLVATNASRRAGGVEYRVGGGVPQSHALSAPALTGDYRVDESPMGTMLGLRQVLRCAVELFPPERHRYVLLLKSHSQEGYAAVPRLSVRHEDWTQQELLALVHGESDARTVDDASWLRRSELFDLLAELVERDDAHFPLVVLESCRSGVGLCADELPEGVDAVAAARGEAAYRNFDLSTLGSEGEDPAARLREQAAATSPFVIVSRPPASSPWRLLPMGLALMLLGRTILRLRAALRTAP